MAKKYTEEELETVCKKKYGLRAQVTSVIGAVSSTTGTLLTMAMIFGFITIGSVDIPTMAVTGSSAGVTIGGIVFNFILLTMFVLLAIFGFYLLLISERVQ